MGSPSEFYRVLDECIEAIESERATIERCLIQHPEHRTELQQLLPLVSALHHAPRVETPADFRDGARQRLLARLPETRGHATGQPSRRHRRQRARPLIWRRGFGAAWLAAVAVIIILLAGGGIAYAADGAVPGDTLYNLDRSIEELRFALTKDPQASFELQLALASERLEEAKKALGEERIDQFNVAMDHYDGAIYAIAETLQTSAVAEKAILGGLLDEAIAVYDAQLADMVEGEMVQIRDRDRDHWCLDEYQGDDRHPVVERLAEEYGVGYEDIIGWFCDGFGLGEIGLAYRIHSESRTPVGELFGRVEAKRGWGLVLQEEGLIGRPEDAGPPEDVPQGPSDDKRAPEGTPRGRSGDARDPGNAGPHEDVPQGDPEGKGPPEGVPQGPPDRDGQSEGQGPPEGIPQGRPDEKGLPPGQVKDKP